MSEAKSHIQRYMEVVPAKPAQEEYIPHTLPAPPASENYGHLQVNLFQRLEHPVKTILFTGNQSGDGVTTTLVNFSRNLARDPNVNVLVIDANLRDPALQKLFNTPSSPGLSDLLIDDKVQFLPTRIAPGNLHVLTCGSPLSDPVTLLSSYWFQNLLASARERYDYVLLDTPPVHSYPDSCLISGKVDGTVLVVRSGKTRKNSAAKAKSKLEETGATMLGVVLNRRKFHIPDFIYKRL